MRRRPVVVAPRRRPSLIGTMATTAVVAGTATAVSGAVAGHQRSKAQAQQEEAMAEQTAAQNQADVAALQQQLDAMQAQEAAPQAAAAPAAGNDLMAQLQQLTQMKESGLLTDEQFEAAKTKLLGA